MDKIFSTRVFFFSENILSSLLFNLVYIYIYIYGPMGTDSVLELFFIIGPKALKFGTAM